MPFFQLDVTSSGSLSLDYLNIRNSRWLPTASARASGAERSDGANEPKQKRKVSQCLHNDIHSIATIQRGIDCSEKADFHELSNNRCLLTLSRLLSKSAVAYLEFAF